MKQNLSQNMMKWIREQGRTAWGLSFGNPVVVRDLRAQMRGTKSYWGMGAFLLLLSVLAIVGYAQSTQQGMSNFDSPHHVNIVDAQGQLSQMYGFIFGTIAAMIILIAPALTAASIVGERQRLSFDLLVTTPLKASEVLIGKLVSSVAFLGLLLCLSLPAATLCVMLGGATLADVFRTYTLFALGGTVLAAIGLFFSCAARTNLLAVIWSYASVGAFCAVTAMAGSTGITHAASPLHAFSVLNPVMAIVLSYTQSYTTGGSSLQVDGVTAVDLFGLHVPIVLGAVMFAFLTIRLFTTAATYRLGFYGAQCASSLRRQVLFVTALGTFLVASNGFNFVSEPAGDNLIATDGTELAVLLIASLLASVAFLPALFVPASREEDLPGALHQQIAGDTARFRMKRAFQPVHSGAFPYFLLWLATMTLGAVAGLMVALSGNAGLHPWILSGLTPVVGTTFVYMEAVGFLLWQISRFAGVAVKTISGARGLAFGIFSLITAFPMMVLALSNVQHWEKSPVAGFSVIYPLMAIEGPNALPEAFVAPLILSSGLCVGLGLLFALLRHAVASRASTPQTAPTAAQAA